MATAYSTAIGSERKSRTAGYKIKRAKFDNETPNLPQQIVILAEANTANQGTITTVKREITSAEEAGRIYGFGSPIHQIMRILRPQSSDGVGGIPTIVMPQLEAAGATASVQAWTVTGPATKNVTHYIRINGRNTLDAKPYAVNIVTGDTAGIIAQKYADKVNSILGSPVIATVVAGVFTLTTKWKGATSAEIDTFIELNGDAAGLAYAKTTNTAGAGAADISAALDQVSEDIWYTTFINSYGVATLSALEAFNGFPDENAPTGRYQGRIFKPFLAFFGSTLDAVADIKAITDIQARTNQVTNVLCPAPKSEGFPWEAAANVVVLFARVAQDTPSLDVAGLYYPDMPTPFDGLIGDMAKYENRDALLKAGSSTVTLVNGAYQIQDLVTTYHPVGEEPLQYNYTRNLNLDWNIADGYRILENTFVKDKVILEDDQESDEDSTIKPKEWKSILYDYFTLMSVSALIKNADFSKNSLMVQVDPDNPNRLNTKFRYRRTGTVRIASTDVEAGF